MSNGQHIYGYQYDDSGNMVHDENYAYGYDPENRLVLVRKSGPYGTLTLGDAMESPLTYTTGGDGDWTGANGGEGHDDMSAAHSPSLAQGQQSWMQTAVQGPGTISFWAKMTPYYSGNSLEFYVGDTLRYSYSDESEEWDQFSWEVTGAGAHTLKWVYERSSETSSSTGYVDDVGWTGALPAVPPPEPAVTNWRYLEYTYDASGRRIEKKYDYETITKYVYDGDHCLAEYNAYNQLKRKYIYGPCTDEPICLIDTMTSPAVTSYYHFDGLGSVVALTDDEGDTVQVYEYDVYGRPGATDASHPNRIMFTGREYDKETGLYYYRARYYNPQIGRFLQTDPAGYNAGMNWYAYCGNNPLNFLDPSGLISVAFYDGRYKDEGFGECADDFDIWIPLEDAYKYGFTGAAGDFVIAMLQSMKDYGQDVTEVYFFDHGFDGMEWNQEEFEKGHDGYSLVNPGITLGDELYSVLAPSDKYPGDLSLKEFAEGLKTATNEGTTLNFRGCSEGLIAKDVAAWSGRTTTGFTGSVYPKANDWNMDKKEQDGYEYSGSGDYVVAVPGEGGTVIETRIPAAEHLAP
jgi:RHS repeat-associated protein